jgi:HEAT repeat protein
MKEKNIIEKLNNVDPNQRREAIFEIQSGNKVEFANEVEQIGLNDFDISCKKSAMFCLRYLNQLPLFTNVAKQALIDKDQSLRLDVAWNISQLDQPIRELFLPILNAIKLSKEDDLAFHMLIYVLGKQGDSRAYEILRNYLNSSRSYIRGLAVQALMNLGDKRAIAEISKLSKDNEIAWEEDHGPKIMVSELVAEAITQLQNS